MMNNVRIVNDYRLIFMPEHRRAVKSGGCKGFVYEHIFVAEEMLQRELRETEVVHHLDNDRSNNRRENLLVIERSQHSKLHTWLSAGAPVKNGEFKISTKFKSAANSPKYCKKCDKTLQEKQSNYCSTECASQSKRKVVRPNKAILEAEILQNSLVAIGKKYGVTHNAVKKWAISYGIAIKNRK